MAHNPGAALNEAAGGIKTSGTYDNRGDGTDDWFQYAKIADGGDTAQGAKADAAVTDPTASGSVVGLLKGLLSFLRTHATGLGKEEDAAHASGDVGVAVLAVRRDTAGTGLGADGDYANLAVDSTGRLRVASVQERPSAATVTEVVDTATSTTLAASNTARRALTVYNTSSAALYLKLGATASTTSFTVKIGQDGYYELPQPVYTGTVDGIWASDPGDGAAYITEVY